MASSGGRRKELLLVAFHFPPIQFSSGVHRTLSFAKFLPRFGWASRVLTVRPEAYPHVDDANLELLPPGLEVIRSFALDAQRHLSIGGKHPGFLSIPDRWQSWIPSGIATGLRAVRRRRPTAIFSTYPVASALVIARAVHRRTGVPWIVDLRDPIVFGDYPAPAGRRRRIYESLERSVFDEAAAVIVATEGAKRLYRKRYPEAPPLHVIENGVDHELFAEVRRETEPPRPGDEIRILHSGHVYANGRDPGPLFAALSILKDEGICAPSTLRIAFRATGCDDFVLAQARRHGVDDLIDVLPPVAYRDALLEMCSASGLLVLQGKAFDSQIPAKVYEYLASGRPILALTGTNGETGRMLRAFGVDALCPLEDRAAIVDALRGFVARLRSGDTQPAAQDLYPLSRCERTERLARVLDETLGALGPRSAERGIRAQRA